MALSNIAVPKYYGIWREKVIRGIIPVCREIEMEMNRIDKLIADPRYYYDDLAVEGWIRFCENEMTLTDGSDLILLESFKLWGEQALSWYEFREKKVYIPGGDGHPGRYVDRLVKTRLTQVQYVIVARSNAKSLYASLLQAYMLIVDSTTTHQVTVAPNMVQAEEVMQSIRTALTRARGPALKFLTDGSLQNTTGDLRNRKKLASTKKGIQNFLTNSILEVRVLGVDKLQGLRIKMGSIDEWLSGDVRENVVDALTQGASKGSIEEFLILAISSEGTVRNGIGDEVKVGLMKILQQEVESPHISIWHYRLDDISEVGNPEMWPKACPNIGVTVSYETYAKDVARAEANPSARNDILAKRFGLPMEGYTYFFTYEETIAHARRDFRGMRCALGADLSRGDDFCSFTFLFPLGGDAFGIQSRNYITENTLDRLPPKLRSKYDEFRSEESLVVMPGIVLDMGQVYDDLEDYIDEYRLDVGALGYDPYNSPTFLEKYTATYGEYFIEKVIQGARTMSVPLGELKHLASERLLLFYESVFQFAMGNAAVKEDINGNRQLIKHRKDAKIDPVAALTNAYIAYRRFEDEF